MTLCIYIQDNDTQHNDTQHNETQHNDSRHYLYKDAEHIKPGVYVVKLVVIMLSVVYLLLW